MRPEHRKSRRHIVSYRAKVSWDRGAREEACQIWDVSSTGAQLKFKAVDGLPDKFRLLLSPDGKAYRRCSVVWRKETSVGVRFIPENQKRRLGPVMLSGCNTCRSDRLWIVAAGKVKQLVKQ